MATRFEEFYLRFENKFRGERTDIKSRQTVYLPVINLIDRSNGYKILDIGCGRGEWLELLLENNFNAYGLDRNKSMVENCTRMGLDVQYGDAIDHLKSLPGGSLAAITGFSHC